MPPVPSPRPRRPVLFVAAAGLVAAGAAVPPAAGQPPADRKDGVPSTPIAFKSHDDVTLQGELYRTRLGGTRPVVLLLHAAGAEPPRAGLRDLAQHLAGKGYHVFRFDFRGHGESTLINPGRFFDDPVNKWAFPRQARDRNPKPKLTLAEVRAARNGDYLPRLADDVMAARVAMDQENDNGGVNTSSVYLVGVGNAAAVGLLYASAEWSRPQKFPAVFAGQVPALPPRKFSTVLRPGDPSCGLDLAACVWLSAELPGQIISARTANQWVDYAPDLRERTPMLFLFGAEDAAGRRDAGVFLQSVLGRGAPALTQARAVGKTKLRGAELVGKGLGTEDTISDFLDAVDKERKNQLRLGNRGYVSPPPINLPLFGVCKF